MKQKLLMLFIFSLFFFSVFEPNFSSTAVEENIYDIPRLLNTTSQLEVQELGTTKISPSLSVQEQETWQLSHSVKVDYIQKNFTVKDSKEDLVSYFGFEYKFDDIDTPTDIVTDVVYLYVADADNNRVQKFAKTGEFVLTWGSAGTGDGEFNGPYGIAIDNDYIYVTDRLNRRVQKFNKTGGFVLTWGSEGTGDGEFDDPCGVAVDNDYVYVTDRISHRVQKFNKTGTFIAKWGSYGMGDGEFDDPCGVAVDNDYVYVTDRSNHRVQKFNKTGTFIAKWGSYGTGDGEFNSPYGVAVDNDYVYVTDRSNHRVQNFNKIGTFIAKWGSYGTGDGEFDNPWGIAVDNDYVYVVNYNKDEVQRFITSSDQIDVSNYYDVFLSDGSYAKYEFSPVNNPMYSANTTLTFNMYDLSYPAEAGIKFKLDVIDGNGNLENAITDTSLTITFDSSATYGASELVLYVYVGFSVDDGYVVLIVLFDTGTGEIKSSIKQQGTVTRISKFMFYIDHIWVESISVSSNPRFDYYSTSTDSLLMRLYLEVYDFRIPIKIYTDYALASITPNALTGRDTSDSFLWVNDTVPLTYMILFNVDLSKQYLAISQTYNFGFEGEIPDNFVNHATNPYETAVINSTIVKNGAFSLGLKNTAGTGYYKINHPVRDDWDCNDWYIHISAYTIGSTDIYFNYYDGASYINIDLTSSENRWEDTYYFYKSGTNAAGYFYIQTASTSITAFIELDFWQVNHQVETSEWRKIKVSGQMISWDGYDNPVVPSETVQLELRDRTADSSIVSTSKITDFLGNFEWEIDTSSYSALQDQREIEFRSYSVENRFYNSLADEFENELSSYTFTGASGSFSEEDDYFKGEVSGDGSWEARIQPTSSNFDISNFDVFYFEIKANASYTVSQIRHLGDWDGGGYPEFNYAPDISVTTSWQTFTLNRYDMTEGRLPDDSDMDSIIFSSPDTTELTIYLKNCHYIQAQKSYFTPLLATDFPFYYETDPSNNEWDWSEETTESFTNLFTTDFSATTGYLWLSNASQSYFRTTISGLSIDSSVYTRMNVRIKANDTCDFGVWNIAQSAAYSTLYSLTTSYQVLDIDLSSDPDWTGTIANFNLLFEGFTSSVAVYIDFVRLIHRDTPNISTADSYAWVSSSNNSFVYRTEIDSNLQGYYSDLAYFSTDQTLGDHTLNATVYDDLDRSNIVFLPGTSVTSSYSITTDFYVSVENIYASDEYMNIFVTASKSGSYTIFENDSNVGSGNFDKDGTSISHSKDTTYGVFIELAYEFVNSTDTVWFNTSYDITDYTHLIVYISTPILVDGRISIGVTSNLGNSHVKLDDDSKTGIEVNYENEGVFSWYSHIAGENNITIDVRNDANSDGDYLDTGETFSDTVSYHLYDDDLIVYFSYLLPYTDEGTTYIFASNYRGTGLAEFRCRTQDQLGWSQWLSEDTYNGSYDFTFVNCDLDTTYNFSAEIRVYVTDESSGYQYYYDRFEYTPYSPDPIVQNPQGVNLPEESEEIIPEGFVQITAPNKAEFFITVFVLFIILVLIMVGVSGAIVGGMYLYFENRKEDESPIDFSTRVITEQSMKASDKVTDWTLGTIGMSPSKKDEKKR